MRTVVTQQNSAQPPDLARNNLQHTTHEAIFWRAAEDLDRYFQFLHYCFTSRCSSQEDCRCGYSTCGGIPRAYIWKKAPTRSVVFATRTTEETTLGLLRAKEVSSPEMFK